MDKLKFISEQMNILSIPYAFMRWSDDIQYPYFVGEYSEVPTTTEDGAEETSFIITGTTRNDWLELEQYKEKIKNHFPAACGLCDSTDSGSIAVFYDNAFPVPTGEADLKRIQINLTIKQWKGMN